MIQVRDVLQARFGKVDQAADLFRNFPAMPAPYSDAFTHFSVLTDISGAMYTVVNEWVAPTLSAWDRAQEQVFTSPDFTAWFKQFQLFVEGGRREFYHVEGAYDDWSRPGVIVVRESYHAHKWQIEQAVLLLQRYGALLADRAVAPGRRGLRDATGRLSRATAGMGPEARASGKGRGPE